MNMSNMIGVGPFLTIPLILKTMGGPQAMLGWVLGAVLAICDGMIWAELASAVPRSGGTLEYLKAAYAHTSLGRLLPFLFIWQFILSGPLEIASGSIGFAQYLTYLVPMKPLCTAVPGGRRERAGGRAPVSQDRIRGKAHGRALAGRDCHHGRRAAAGAAPFRRGRRDGLPLGAMTFSQGFVLGLGSAMLLVMYNFFGYYSVCYIGEEVRQPARTIPRSILLAVLVVAAMYLAMQGAIISVVPWREAAKSDFVGSLFIETLYGRAAAVVVTLLICWTAFASVFALMLLTRAFPTRRRGTVSSFPLSRGCIPAAIFRTSRFWCSAP